MTFSMLAIFFNSGIIIFDNNLGLYCLVIVSFFMSLMFPTIYGIALEDFDVDESKIGSAGLVMAIVGGALMPKIKAMIIDLGGNNVDDITVLGMSEINFSFVLPLFSFIIIAIYGYKNSGRIIL